MKARMNMSLYNGSYNCACGSKHEYMPHINLHAQGKWRVVMECPSDKNCFTNVKIKTGFLGFGFKGFESIAGIKCGSEQERVSLVYTFNSLR